MSMKKAYVIMGLLTAAALTLVAQEDHTSRAGVGEKAFIIINHIKYDKNLLRHKRNIKDYILKNISNFSLMTLGF